MGVVVVVDEDGIAVWIVPPGVSPINAGPADDKRE
jgi:hypothetical protein